MLECYSLNAGTLHRDYLQRSTLLVTLLLVLWFLVGWSSLPFGSSIQSSSSTRTLRFQGTFGYLFLRTQHSWFFLVPQAETRACALIKAQYPFFMEIPFANRTGIIIIPDLALRDKPTLPMAEIRQNLFKVIPKEEFVKVVCCVQYMRRTRLHITFTSPDKMEDILHRGITIRGTPSQ